MLKFTQSFDFKVAVESGTHHPKKVYFINITEKCSII